MADRRFYSDGHAVWFIDELWPVANALPAFDLDVTALKQLDEVGWFSDAWGKRPTYRAVIDHCRRIRDANLSYPIILAPEVAPHDGCVLDGMHRIARTLFEGGTAVRAVRLPEMPPPTEVLALDDPRRRA